jgi:serine/threonine-protein kinase
MANHEVIAERYALGGVLGRGGMGTVYAADDLILGREVAVKILDVASAPADALDRFRHEGQFLAGLSHPNVVTIFDFGTDEHVAWLVMELLPGPTLDKLLADHGPLPVERVISYGQQCAAALAAAHAAGITHRDVKPANLMLATDGRCVLVDLGIARLGGATTSTRLALTGKGNILGTVAFVAPEIITGGAPGPPADVYALGAVLFNLLTGHAPFAGDTSAAIFGQHVYAEPPRPSSARTDTPAALDDLVMCLLAKDPGARPNAATVARNLAGLAGVAGLAAVAPAAGPGANTQPATSPLPYPPSAVTTVTPVPAPAPTQVLSAAPAAAVEPAVRPHPWRKIAALVALALGVAVAVAVLLSNANNVPDPASRATPAPSVTQPGSPATATPTPTPTTPATTVAPPDATAPPVPSDSGEAVAALGAAIASLADSGEFDPSKAQEAQDWLDDFSKELRKRQPKDLRKKIGELDQNLTEYVDNEEITPEGYDLLVASLRDLSGTL